MLLSNDPIKTNTLVRVTIEIETPPDTLEVEGIVRWCKSDRRRPDLFYVGIEFQGLDTIQQVKIARMREWFSSPEFKVKEATRRRSRPKADA